MNWEVSGANCKSGEGLTLVVEADDERSAVRRGSRRGVVVEWVRPLGEDNGVASTLPVATATATAPVPAPSDSVGYAYVAPAFQRRRKKASGGTGIAVAGVSLVAAAAGWLGWHATRPIEGALPEVGMDVSTAAVSPTVAPPAVTTLPAVPAGPSLHMTAAGILRAHELGLNLAMATFAGRTIAVDGRVETVGTDLFGTPCIGLGSVDSAAPGGRVQCVFRTEESATLNAVKAGDMVTVRGRYDGVNGGDVQLVACQVLPGPTTTAGGH